MADPLDTSDEARRIQFERWRAMTPQERLLVADDLCRAADAVARAGILAQHPDATEQDVLWHLADRRYGRALADAAFGDREASG